MTISYHLFGFFHSRLVVIGIVNLLAPPFKVVLVPTVQANSPSELTLTYLSAAKALLSVTYLAVRSLPN
jgi:hypothetical protein